MRIASAIAVLGFVACVDPLTTQPASMPEWTARNVRGYAETAAGPPPDEVLGWDLVTTGEVARWSECTSIDACGTVERRCAAKDLIAIAHVGKTSVDGHDIDVLKLSLAPKARYVVPAFAR